MRDIKCFLVFIFLFLTSCGGGGGSSNPSTLSIQPSVNGFYYAFEGAGATIEDSSGNQNDATATGISRVFGKVGNAVEFLGVGSIIEPSSNAFPSIPSLTFRAWIKTSSNFVQREQLIGAWTGGQPGAFEPFHNFGIAFADNKLRFEVSAYPGILFVESTVLPIVQDQWFHVASTYDGSTVKFYFNGLLMNSESIVTNFNSSFSNKIGHSYHVWAGITIVNQFFGAMDELYLEEQVLSDQDVLDYFNSTN